MASNIATQRIISRLPETIPRAEIADDIWVVPAAAAAELRALLEDQPHFIYFLDRGITANEFAINLEGDKVWVLKSADFPSPGEPLIPRFAREVKSEVALTTRPETLSWTAKGGVVASSHLLCPTATFARTDWATSVGPDWSMSYPHGGKAVIWAKMFGSVPIGPSVTMALDGAAHTTAQAWESAIYPEHLTAPYKSTGSGIWAPRMVAVSSTAVPTENLKKDWIMLTGPSGLDYGEVFDSFTFVLSRASTVAERMRTVVAFAKTKPNAPDCTEVEKAMADLEATESLILAFKGSADVDPVHMWPEARGAVESMAGIEPDGESVTAESKASGVRQWLARRWCVTAVKESLVQDEILEVLSGSGPVTVKRSGPLSVHVDDGEGIIELAFQTARSVIRNALAAGRTVTYIASAFDDPLQHPQEEWLELKLTSAAEPVESSLAQSIPEAICTRLITPPMFSDKEELVMLPIVSPQSMWSDYARAAPSEEI